MTTDGPGLRLVVSRTAAEKPTRTRRPRGNRIAPIVQWDPETGRCASRDSSGQLRWLRHVGKPLTAREVEGLASMPESW